MVEVRDAAKQPIKHRTVLTVNSYPAQNGNNSETGKL